MTENAFQSCNRARQTAEAENAKLRRVVEAVRAMRANVSQWGPDAQGKTHHYWFIVAPCEYGEAVDEALAALDQP